jgi:hypothetical protein
LQNSAGRRKFGQAAVIFRRRVPIYRPATSSTSASSRSGLPLPLAGPQAGFTSRKSRFAVKCSALFGSSIHLSWG